MHTAKILATTQALLLTLIYALPTETNDDFQPSLSRRGLEEAPSPSPFVLEVPIRGFYPAYYVDVEIGVPIQKLTLQLVTSSGKVMVFDERGCANSCRGGIYSLRKSSTYKTSMHIGDFTERYPDGLITRGRYAQDVLNMGNYGVPNAYIGIANDTSGIHEQYGIMGIGFDTDHGGKELHPGILKTLYTQGAITHLMYSIHLEHTNVNSSSILFGGVDQTKHQGELVYLPMMANVPGDREPRLQIEWTYLSVIDKFDHTTQLTTSGFARPAELNIGSSHSLIPVDMFNQLQTYFPSIVGPLAQGTYHIDCKVPSGSLTFGFGEGPAVVINVPFTGLIAKDLRNGTCELALMPQTGPVMVLGSNFLRNTYLNFNFKTLQIGIAQSI